MMFEKLHRFLQLHWKIILFGVIFEILITIGAVRLTYILSKPFCETGRFYFPLLKWARLLLEKTTDHFDFQIQ